MPETLTMHFSKKIDDQTWEVGVHIADVSNYVRENTAIDREAKKRQLYLLGWRSSAYASP